MSSPAHAKGRVPIELIQLAERGARLFPLAPHSKTPLVARWQQDNNTSDPEMLADILGQVPDCNWGMLCGPESGMLVLDFDRKNNQPGMLQYQKWLEEYGPEWADTLQVTTPSLGRHLYYPWETGIRKDNTGRLAPGVDVQGLRSFVVTPPSEIDGRYYHFENCDGEKDLAPLPEFIKRILLVEPKKVQEKSNGHPRVYPGRKFGEHERHNVLKSEAGRLANARISYDGLLAHFRQINREWFEPSYPDDELVRQARDMHHRWAPKDSRPIEVATGLALQPYSQIQLERIEWEWLPYVPCGTLSLITGEVGVGKSFIGLWIAAKITREGGNVLHFTIENSPGKINLPRFQSLGGDVSRLFRVKGVQYGDPSDGIVRRATLEDVPVISHTVRQNNIRFSIIDPIQSYLGAKVDMHRANETRPVLDGLLEMTEELDTTMLVIRHGRKGGVGRIVEKGLGSIDISGAARSELYAGKTSEGVKAMLHIKSSWGPEGPTLGYEITGMRDGVASQGGFFAWTGELDISAQDLMNPEESREEISAHEEAERFLVDYLGDGPKWQKEVFKKSRAEGIKEITLRRAKLNLKVGSEKREGVWWWNLPSTYK